MASISHDKKNGRRTIQFKDTDGSRKSIRLGKCDQKTAQAIRTQIEHLVSAKGNGTAIPQQTTEWLRTIDEDLRGRIAATGLIDKRKTFQLAAFISDYIESRVDAAESTKAKWRITAGHLEEHLGKEKPMHSITPGDADEFRLFLIGNKLAENTVRGYMAVAKMLFTGAVRRKQIERNPFTGQKASTLANHSRYHFVSHQDAHQLIEAAPDWQWRLIIALSRFGGVRCPSELLLLRWQDINWSRNRMTVTSPKTKHSGKESRQTPLFPELRPLLAEGLELAKDKSEFIITRYRDASQNLRTTFLKIIERAGLVPWPKLFQNMRSSRETELVETYPVHVVTAWLGNTASVAAKHYLQTTEEHFEKAVQNPVQQAAEMPRNAPLPAPLGVKKPPKTRKTNVFEGIGLPRRDSNPN